ncbi:hypothetical protein PV620_30980, partial [Streptomyces sp. ME02-6978a]
AAGTSAAATGTPASGGGGTGAEARAAAAPSPAEAQMLAASLPDDPGSGTAASVPTGRPGRPLLAGAAVLGAVLVAVPVLLVNRDRTTDTHNGVVADQAGTVLGEDGAEGPGAPYASSTASPSSSSTGSAPAKIKKEPGGQAFPGAPTGPVTSSSGPASSPTRTTSSKTTKVTTKKKSTTKKASKPSYPASISVSATRVLRAGQSLNAKRARLHMQTDGNLVVYDENNHARWATMTFGSNYQAVFQADGNLVVYTSSNRPVWASNTYGHNGSVLKIQEDGNVVIYENGRAIWASNTKH